jgi:hypothetical protein
VELHVSWELIGSLPAVTMVVTPIMLHSLHLYKGVDIKWRC